MKDKSLGIWLAVLFAIPGIAVLMLAWLWPALVADKIAASFVGSAGILIASIQVLRLKHSPGRLDGEPTTIQVEAEDRS